MLFINKFIQFAHAHIKQCALNCSKKIKPQSSFNKISFFFFHHLDITNAKLQFHRNRNFCLVVFFSFSTTWRKNRSRAAINFWELKGWSVLLWWCWCTYHPSKTEKKVTKFIVNFIFVNKLNVSLFSDMPKHARSIHF